MLLSVYTTGRTTIPWTPRGASPGAWLRTLSSMERTFDFLVPSSKLPVHALPHWLNTSRSRSSSPTDTSCWIADAFSFLRFANKGNFVGRAPIWYRLTPEFSDELFGGRGACLVSAEIEKNL